MNSETNLTRELSTLRRLSTITIFIFLVVGIGLRVHGAATELWLDEIWSINNVKDLSSPLEILGSLTSDNNHLINSLWLYFLSTHSHPLLLRAISVFFALGSLYLTYAIGNLRSPLHSAVFMTLIAVSYPVVIYSTEARGYAGLIFFLLLSFYHAVHWIKAAKISNALWLNCACALGVMAHFSFLQFLPALAIWCLLSRLKSGSGKKAVSETIFLFSPVLAVVGWLYLTHIRFISEGSGPLKGYLEVTINALSVSVGGFEMSPISPWRLFVPLGLAVLVCITALIEIMKLRKEDDNLWMLYLTGIFVVPALTLFVMQPRVIFIRYFLPAIMLLYLLLAGLFTRWLKDNSPKRRYIGLILLLGYIALHGVTDTRFIYNGRGNYTGLTSEMLTASPNTTVSYSSDHDYRNPVLIEYLSERLGEKNRFRYIDHEAMKTVAHKPDWYITHSLDSTVEPQPDLMVAETAYSLHSSYYHTALSGFSGHLYRRVDRTPAVNAKSSQR